ncbi:MAG TPA: HNH endonuclease, partial [Anaeromyxobacteraceae bacterium]|nr:HNH endonuclease [Anaeromyxobacteraceae bacterium]
MVEPLRDGRLCISSVVELARVATRENLREVLPRFFHRSRREAREVAVEISPAAVIPRREVTTPVEV